MSLRTDHARLLAVAACVLAFLVTVAIPTARAGSVPGEPAAADRPLPPTQAEVRRETPELDGRRPLRARGVVEPLPIEGSRIVSYYGAPQLSRTVVGRNSVTKAKQKLERQAGAYERRSQLPAVPAFDIIASIATADAGRDGLYRLRQSRAVLDAYQRRIERLGGRLVLDIQPGRARLADELRAFKDRIQAPGVDVAVDPEWMVGRRGVPGRTTGHINAAQVNRAAATIARWSEAADAGPKLLIVHQFRTGSIRDRSKIREPEGVDVVLNFDGIGSPGPKVAGYQALSRPRLDAGFSLFYSLDQDLMSPSRVMALDPEARYVMYQ